MVHSVLKNKQAHCERLRQLFETLGDAKTGVITFKMLEEKMHSPEVRAYFEPWPSLLRRTRGLFEGEVLGLDVWDAWSFFKLLDLDQRGDIEIEKFLMGCLRLRGNAKAIDMCKLIHDQAWLLKTQSNFHSHTDPQLWAGGPHLREEGGVARARRPPAGPRSAVRMEELEDEVVEAPHASQKVQLPSSQDNLDVLGNATGKLPHLKTPSNEGLGGDLSHWLLQLRDDLFRRLDGQDLMLSILIGGDFDAQSVVTELSTNFLDSCHEKASDNEKPTDEEVEAELTVSSKATNQTPEVNLHLGGVGELSEPRTSVGDVGGMSSLKAFRIIRITRVIKVVRLMRVFRFVMAFRTLIASIAETLKSLFWALMLLGVVIYVFAVLFTQAVNDYIAEPDNPMPERLEGCAFADTERPYFGSLYDTMLSLFESIANGVSWNQVLAPLRYISPIWAVVYLFYIFFTYFTVLNVVTAVFCQAAVETAQNDHAAMVQSVLKNKKAHCEKLQHLFSTLGDQCTGTITFKMLQDRMNCPKVRAYFEVLGLDIWDVARNVPKTLRGQASAIDMGKLLHDQTWLMKNLGKFQTHVAQEFHHLRKEIRAIEPKLNSKSPVSVSRSITRGKSPLPSSSATTPTMSRHIDELAQSPGTSCNSGDRKSPRAERLQTGEGEG
eukprot:g19703.t1